MATLNDKQKLFALEYMVDRNATKAAERAGYSKKTAKQQGSRLLSNVDIQALIQGSHQKRAEKLEITTDRVVQEIAMVAFANMGLVCDWDEEGNLKLTARDSMSPEGLAALNMIQKVDTYAEGEVASTKLSFKLNDKLKALELLTKYLGILDGSGAKKDDTGSAKSRLLSITKRIGLGAGGSGQ